jgi:hypothetical protein
MEQQRDHDDADIDGETLEELKSFYESITTVLNYTEHPIRIGKTTTDKFEDLVELPSLASKPGEKVKVEEETIMVASTAACGGVPVCFKRYAQA